MSKEISFSNNCSQKCSTKHIAGKDHTFIELRRFKNKLTEFLSIDDEHWFPAFEIGHQLDQLMNTIQKLKNELDSKIIEKRLMYALNLQTDKKVLNIFKMANQDRFEELSCEDVAFIKNRIDKNRNPKASQIQSLINNLMKEQRLKLIEQISQSFARFKDNEEAESPSRSKHVSARSEEFYPVEKVQRIQRKIRVRREQQVKQQRNNDLPTIKVDEIEATDGHFNIVLKVIKVKKEFTLPDNKRKIEFEGGDETGKAIVVVDSLSMITPGAVIKINNAKVYSFHGIKQIQQNLKNSYLEKEDRDLRVSDAYNFSITRSRRQPREQKEFRDLREHREPRDRERRQQRKVSRHTQSRELNQERQIQSRRNRLDRSDLMDRSDRLDRADRQQFENVYNSRREQQVRQTRNRDQNQRVDVSREQTKRELPKKQQQSGEYSDDEADDSEEQQVIKKASQREKIEIKANNKTLAKIKDIEPQMENISLIAEIVSIGKSNKNQRVEVSNNSIFAVLGDDTGTIWAELPQNIPFLRENSVIHLVQITVQVHQTQCRLILRLNETSEVNRTTMRMPKINLENDLSQQRWEQLQSQQEVQDQKPIVEDF